LFCVGYVTIAGRDKPGRDYCGNEHDCRLEMRTFDHGRQLRRRGQPHVAARMVGAHMTIANHSSYNNPSRPTSCRGSVGGQVQAYPSRSTFGWPGFTASALAYQSQHCGGLMICVQLAPASVVLKIPMIPLNGAQQLEILAYSVGELEGSTTKCMTQIR
jgi:hypothetical protein